MLNFAKNGDAKSAKRSFVSKLTKNWREASLRAFNFASFSQKKNLTNNRSIYPQNLTVFRNYTSNENRDVFLSLFFSTSDRSHAAANTNFKKNRRKFIQRFLPESVLLLGSSSSNACRNYRNTLVHFYFVYWWASHYSSMFENETSCFNERNS